MIAATLASALARRGERVALADADRQQSALGWLQRRPDSVAHVRGLDWSKGSAIGDHPARLDWLVIDAPGALKGSKADALIAEATAVLAPVQPSVFDENATRGFLADIDAIKRVRKGRVAVHLVANRLCAGSRGAGAGRLLRPHGTAAAGAHRRARRLCRACRRWPERLRPGTFVARTD